MMSLTEMKESAKQLTAAELEDFALHIQFLRQIGDPVWQEKMLQRALSPGRWHFEEEIAPR
jgi:hypothetical protein